MAKKKARRKAAPRRSIEESGTGMSHDKVKARVGTLLHALNENSSFDLLGNDDLENLKALADYAGVEDEITPIQDCTIALHLLNVPSFEPDDEYDTALNIYATWSGKKVDCEIVSLQLGKVY